jgi:ribulose-phosphate 3-epimerase
MGIIVPAVLPSSRQDLEEKLSRIVALSVSRVQIDVVDGRFAAPASWPFSAGSGAPELDMMARGGEFLPALERIGYEVDLMGLNPERMVGTWIALGVSRFTFHAESLTDISRVLADAHDRYGRDVVSAGLVSFGLALNIESDLSLIESHLSHVDYVQFMGIARIGRQGQPFDRRVLEKIRTFRGRHPTLPTQVDGGVSLDTAPELLALGVESLVVGSALLRSDDPAALVEAFEALRSPFAA